MLKFRALALSLRRRANARNVSTSFLPYGGITYLINSFDYPNLLYTYIYIYTNYISWKIKDDASILCNSEFRLVCMLSSATTALSTLCQGRTVSSCVYIMINIMIIYLYYMYELLTKLDDRAAGVRFLNISQV